MRILYSAILVSGFFFSSSGQAEFHPIVKRAQETSYYSEGLSWEQINSQFTRLIGYGKTTEELRPGLQYLVNSLGDKHGSFRSSEDYSIVVSYSGPVETDDRDSDFVNTVINDVNSRFSYERSGDIGYLKLVAIGPQKSVEENSKEIRNAVNELADQGIEKWIVDLRFNGGGNVGPMVAGLANLIGDGEIGGSVDAKNDLVQAYKIHSGVFLHNDRVVCNFEDYRSDLAKQKVVVLLSRYTISSGEMVAVAFKGRKNTWFLGEPTAGYTTGNGFDRVTDDLVMVISESVFADRNKNVYQSNVGVDEEMEFRHTTELSKDQQVARAIEWLNQ